MAQGVSEIGSLAALFERYGGWALSACLVVVIVVLDRRNQSLNADRLAEAKAGGQLALRLADRNASLIARTVAAIRAPRG
jgi:hypothetical protein